MNKSPRVVAICIAPEAGAPMQEVQEVEAIAGAGLKGDRYCTAKGSFSAEKPGKRQVTLMNYLFFEGSGFDYVDSRRNLFTADVELMWLIGREFRVDGALLRGVKYCDPCDRPSKLIHDEASFKEVFLDRGGLIADIVSGGIIKVNSQIVIPPKGY
ncbi:MOSC domain-containing protein [Candidatus Pacebacteria bacterium]|nr:MOSC domain-containing protein [Candidatus Paceibacterota bacterium]